MSKLEVDDLKERIKLWKSRKGKFVVIQCKTDSESKFTKNGIVKNVLSDILILKNIHNDNQSDIPVSWITSTVKVEDFNPNNHSPNQDGGGSS